MLFLLVFGLLVQVPLMAQEPLAAVLEITYAGVELKRANTDEWLPLPVGAQAPFGIGDSLRTGKTGRVLLSFDDAAQTLVMPLSEFQLQTFVKAADKMDLKAKLVSGRSIQQISDPSRFESYLVEMQHMTLQAPTALFATQVFADVSSDVIVAQGAVTAVKGDEQIELNAGSGIRAGETFGEVVNLTPPQGFPFLAVGSDTCRALIQSTIPGETSVSVRIGPGEGYLNLGNILNGTIIPILGVADEGGRYLTPYLSTYGWLIPSGVTLQSCNNLPLIPAEAQIIYGVINPASFEMDLLVPFFGTPTENSRFYSYE